MKARIHLKEFIVRKPELQNDVVLSGFKAYLKGVTFMTLDEWNEELDRYNNRLNK